MLARTTGRSVVAAPVLRHSRLQGASAAQQELPTARRTELSDRTASFSQQSCHRMWTAVGAISACPIAVRSARRRRRLQQRLPHGHTLAGRVTRHAAGQSDPPPNPEGKAAADAPASASTSASTSSSTSAKASSGSTVAAATADAPVSTVTAAATSSTAPLAESSADKQYQVLTEQQRSAVSGIFFPDAEELDMDKQMPLDDHLREAREGLLRAGVFALAAVSGCLYFYKQLTQMLEAPALNAGGVKFVQLGPGEFFFVSLKVAIFVGLLIAFPYAIFEAALYFTPALTRTERGVVGPVVLGSSVLFYAGVGFAFFVLSPAALGFFLSYSEGVIESEFSIDQYFEFILSMGFATGLAFQVPILQVILGYLGILESKQLFAVWRYVIVGSAVIGAILTPSTDPVTQLLLSGALCLLYFSGAAFLQVTGR